MKVFVVMKNDYPAAVFASQALADEFIRLREQDKQLQNAQVWTGPIFWRAYDFELAMSDVAAGLPKRSSALDIIDRLKLLARGDNLDLADIVCADAIAEIERLRSQPKSSAERRYSEKDVAEAVEKVIRDMLERGEISDTRDLPQAPVTSEDEEFFSDLRQFLEQIAYDFPVTESSRRYAADFAYKLGVLVSRPTPEPQAPKVPVNDETRHYLGAIREHLDQLYQEHPNDPRLREHIGDEVSWIDGQIGERPEADRTDELGLYDLGESFLAEYERAIKDGALPDFVCAESPVEVLWHLINQVDDLHAALEPFAAVALSDIGQDETDADAFQPMRSGYNRAPLITVGDMRRAASLVSRPAPEPQAPTHALADIAAERQRQISAEGWSPEHDDSHVSGELAMAAAVYALTSFLDTEQSRNMAFTRYWPWDRCWFKPAGGRRDLVRAAALILAEIDRLDRASPVSRPNQEPTK